MSLGLLDSERGREPTLVVGLLAVIAKELEASDEDFVGAIGNFGARGGVESITGSSGKRGAEICQIPSVDKTKV